jgi:uncharacterized protein YndB with AHSA1/START domain
MRYVREEIVDAPAARVWQLLVDVEGWPAWTESMREIKRLEDGPLVVGSRSRVTQPKGRPMVTQLEPMREFTWVAAQPGLSLEAVHRIDDVGDDVRTTLEFIGTGPLTWLANLIAGSRIRSYLNMESGGPEAGRRDGLTAATDAATDESRGIARNGHGSLGFASSPGWAVPHNVRSRREKPCDRRCDLQKFPTRRRSQLVAHIDDPARP